MRALVSLLVAAAIAFAAYRFYLTRAVPTESGAGAPTQAISITGVKNDLLAIANAERAWFAQNGRYASLDELLSSGALSFTRPGRDGYTYTVETSDAGFTVTARHPGSGGLRFPTLTIDQTMRFRQQD